MDIQSQLVHALEERAGLDEATAERVAQVAIDFSKEHASELPGKGTGMFAVEGADAPPAEGAGELRGAAEEFGVTAMTEESRVESFGATDATEEPDSEKHGGLGGLLSHLTGH